MPRPVKPRWIEFYPSVTYFKPAGIPMRQLEEVVLGVDEFEAIRLKDLLGLDQEDCAERMNLAQSSFQRILVSARSKVASALVEGKAVRIEGGNFVVSPIVLQCQNCDLEWIQKPNEDTHGKCPSCGGENIVTSRRTLDTLDSDFRGPHRHRRGRR